MEKGKKNIISNATLLSKCEKGLELLKLSALFILIFITNILVITNFLFLFKVSITKYHLPIIYFISIFSFVIMKRKRLGKVIVSIIIASFIFLISTMAIGKVYDVTADGNTYHKLAVGAMKNGWNPVYQSIGNFNKDKGNPFDILKDNVNVKWVDHYARGTETFGAVIYSFTGNIETGKVYNILWVYIGLFLIYGILCHFGLGCFKSLVLALVLAFNPIILTQITNYYLDGVLTISLFIIILSCLLMQKKQSKLDECENYLILGLALIWCINAKFTGLAFAGIFCLVYYLYNHIRNYIKDKDKFKSLFIKDTIFYVIVLVVSVLIVGSSTYVKNFVDHGNPLYPLYGKGHVENMVMKEIPKSLQDKNSLTIFLTSLFAKGENVSPSYSNENNQPDLKIPFTTSKEEINNYSIPDIRMAGFGPLFSGILIITFILTILMIVDYIRKKHYNQLIPYLLTLFITMFLILFLDGSYWARYIPYFYLIPVLPLIYYFRRNSKKFNIISLIVVIIFLINSSLIIYTQYKSVNNANEYVAIRLSRFKEYNDSNSEVKIRLAHHGIQGVQYNLDDLGISSYNLVDGQILENDAYMFSY